MEESEFWKLVGRSRRGASNDGDLAVAVLRRQLNNLSREEIVAFDKLLREKLQASNTETLWAAAYLMNGGCSDDSFGYFRCWLVLQGQKIFDEALKDVNSLAKGKFGDPPFGCESLLYLCPEVYEQKFSHSLLEPSLEPSKIITFDLSEESVSSVAPKLFKKYAELGYTPAERHDRAARRVSKFWYTDDSARAYDLAAWALAEKSASALPDSLKTITDRFSIERAAALWDLAEIFIFGLGVHRDYALARKLLTACLREEDNQNENAHAMSHLALGLLDERGLGSAPNPVLAVEHYEKALSKQAPHAEFRLGDLILRSGIRPAEEAVKYLSLERTGLHGRNCWFSTVRYAECLIAGRGCKQDVIAGYKRLSNATYRGIPEAAWLLAHSKDHNLYAPNSAAKKYVYLLLSLKHSNYDNLYYFVSNCTLIFDEVEKFEKELSSAERSAANKEAKDIYERGNLNDIFEFWGPESPRMCDARSLCSDKAFEAAWPRY